MIELIFIKFFDLFNFSAFFTPSVVWIAPNTSSFTKLVAGFYQAASGALFVGIGSKSHVLMKIFRNPSMFLTRIFRRSAFFTGLPIFNRPILFAYITLRTARSYIINGVLSAVNEWNDMIKPHNMMFSAVRTSKVISLEKKFNFFKNEFSKYSSLFGKPIRPINRLSERMLFMVVSLPLLSFIFVSIISISTKFIEMFSILRIRFNLFLISLFSLCTDSFRVPAVVSTHIISMFLFFFGCSHDLHIRLLCLNSFE